MGKKHASQYANFGWLPLSVVNLSLFIPMYFAQQEVVQMV